MVSSFVSDKYKVSTLSLRTISSRTETTCILYANAIRKQFLRPIFDRKNMHTKHWALVIKEQTVRIGTQ